MQTDQQMPLLSTSSIRRAFPMSAIYMTSWGARLILGFVFACCCSAASGQDWARSGETSARQVVVAAELLPPSFEYDQSLAPEADTAGSSAPTTSAERRTETSRLEPLPLGELDANPLRTYSPAGFPPMQVSAPPAHRVIRGPRPPKKPSLIDSLMGVRTSPGHQPSSAPQSGFQHPAGGTVVIPGQVYESGGMPSGHSGSQWHGNAPDHYVAGPLQSDLRESYHPPHFDMRRRFMPPQATILEARQSPSWKTPYSYGYFGASGKRHWSLHHGSRDRATTWNLW